MLDDEFGPHRRPGRAHPPGDARARIEKEVFLRADGEVQTQELLDVIGRLKEGGIERVGIVALRACEAR